jgi:MFS family permease
LGVTAVFMVHATLFASWTAHIPLVKSQLGLSNAALGTALLGAPLGSVTAMMISRFLLPRWGSRRMVYLCVAGYAVAGIAVGQAPSMFWLFVTLSVWGLFQGGLDVAMNTQGVTVEQAAGRPIMTRLHGMWSLGGLSGALIGTGAVSVGIGLSTQLMVMGALALTVVGVLARNLLADQDPSNAATTPDDPSAPARRTFTGAVVLLGSVSFASMLCEGAAADWSANYLSSHLAAPAGVAGLGYAGYTLMMVVMRLSGPVLQSGAPNRTLLPVLAVTGAVGMIAALLTPSPIIGLFGFASLGIGVALVVPTAFSAAGTATADSRNSGPAIAAVAAMGWIGYVTGPPLIGHLADAVGLTAALAVLPILLLIIATVIRLTRAFAPPGDLSRRSITQHA